MNPFTSVLHYLLNVLNAVGGKLASDTTNFLKSFVKDEVGRIAVDVVTLIASSIPNATGDDKRAAAVAQLKADLAKAGKDVESFAASELNWLIENALQAVRLGLTK